MLRIGAYAVAACLVLYALHQLGLWMERRGWIYYWHKQASSGAGSAALGSAMQELNAFAEPAARYAMEEHRSDRKKRDQFDGQPEEDSEDDR